MVLRIEDTDRQRSTPESIEAILDSMRWLGLDWDEGPFFQSELQAEHVGHAERLLEQGQAYRCYCTADEIGAMRERAQTGGGGPAYDRRCRERADAPDGPYTVRFRAPLEGEVIVEDLVRGRISFRAAELEDLIILRSDRTPTYNFSVVVDDAMMRISHVIRGEDHLSNTPKQILIYRALGFPVPLFAHVPLILGLDGGRLSKRHGATAVTAYRDQGYLPDAFNNYLARLGWSHGDQELFQRAELVDLFSLEHVGTSAGVFDPEKLEWVNFQHLKQLDPSHLATAVRPFIEARGWDPRGDDAWLARMVLTLRERARTLSELADMAKYYLCDDLTFDEKAVAKHLTKADPQTLEDLRRNLSDLPSWDVDTIQVAFEQVMKSHELKLGKLAQPVRVALTGGSVSPGIFELAEVLGRERVLARLDCAIKMIG
jgi:glutamyl-tRNA synthetase